MPKSNVIVKEKTQYLRKHIPQKIYSCKKIDNDIESTRTNDFQGLGFWDANIIQEEEMTKMD